MARKPMVTRTIQSTHATVLCMDLYHAEPCNVDVILPRTYKDNKSVLKAAEAKLNSDTLRAVMVVAVEVEEKLYGMTEEDFIAHATILPARASLKPPADEIPPQPIANE